MATLKELTYRLWRLLDGGNISDDTRFTYRELRGYVASGIGLALKQNAYEQRNSGDTLYGNSQFSKTTIKDVKYDEDTELPYIDIKDRSVAFGGTRNFEVSSLNPLSRWAKTFVTIRKEEQFLQKFQTNVPNVIQIIVEGDKGWFYGNADFSNEDKVRLTQYFVIPSVEDDDSELPMPSEYENQVIDQSYILVMREIKQEDTTNDGKPNNPQFN